MHRRLVERFCLAFLKRDRPHGTFAYTRTQAVAIAISNYLRLAVHKLQRTLVTTCDACAAAVAQVSVYFYYRSFHTAKIPLHDAAKP